MAVWTLFLFGDGDASTVAIRFLARTLFTLSTTMLSASRIEEIATRLTDTAKKVKQSIKQRAHKPHFRPHLLLVSLVRPQLAAGTVN